MVGKEIQIRTSRIFFLLLLIAFNSCEKKSPTASDLFSSVPNMNVDVNSFYFKDTTERMFSFVHVKPFVENENGKRYLYVDGQNLIDGLWKLNSDTLYFSPVDENQSSCQISYPIFVLSEFSKPILFSIAKNQDEQCYSEGIYLNHYFSKIHKLVKYGDDTLIYLSMYSLGGGFESPEELKFSNEDRDKLYVHFTNSKRDFSFTDVCISLQHGLLMVKKNKIGLKKLPL